VIKAFLEKNNSLGLYEPNMKTHVLVKTNGTRLKRAFTDGIETWYPFVIDSPERNNKKLTYNFEEHVDAIGMTGWDYLAGQSCWVAFDFDSIVNHKAGLSLDELEALLKKAHAIPWVTIKTSTSGLGYHIYVHFEAPIDTDSHSEHAAVARAVLAKMSALVGFDFANSVDVCGGNMWIYHTKNKGDGFKILKQGEDLCNLPGWEEHKTSKKTSKNYETLATAMSAIQLDSQHQKLLNFLETSGATWWWDSDLSLLVCHTLALKEAHLALNLKGTFETSTTGSSDINCFCFPLSLGAWVIRRFGQGVNESALWETDESGWTKAYYNTPLNLATACRLNGGLENPKGGFEFRDSTDMALAASALKVFFDLPIQAPSCSGKLIELSDGRLQVIINDPSSLLNLNDLWIRDKKTWVKIFNKAKAETSLETVTQYDDIIRHIVTNGENQGWFIKTDTTWNNEPVVHIKLVLDSMGLKAKDRDKLLGSSIVNCWNIVNIPFSKEYPGNRRWNKNSAKLAYTPSPRIPLQLGDIEIWSLLFEHIGSNLDLDVQNDTWCKENGIYKGSDYLIYWIASMIQHPERALPYLFIFSQAQGTGKTLFVKALASLMINGHQLASSALSNPSGFNAEIASAVLCIVEETDLGGDKVAANRMKEWVTNDEILLQTKFKTPCMIKNLSHWVHTSNDHNACPIFTGDTRVVAINIKPFEGVEIDIDTFRERLKKAAPDFLAYILAIRLPKLSSRFGIPVLQTSNKISMQESNKSLLELFIDDKCHLIQGERIKMSDFYMQFQIYLGESLETWSAIRVGKALPPSIPKGRSPVDNQVYLGNISFTKVKNSKPYYLQKGKLIK